MLLKSTAAMRKGDDAEGAWAVAEAATADVLLRLVEKELRGASRTAERVELGNLLNTLEGERAAMTSTARFEQEVARTVDWILGAEGRPGGPASS